MLALIHFISLFGNFEHWRSLQMHFSARCTLAKWLHARHTHTHEHSHLALTAFRRFFECWPNWVCTILKIEKLNWIPDKHTHALINTVWPIRIAHNLAGEKLLCRYAMSLSFSRVRRCCHLIDMAIRFNIQARNNSILGDTSAQFAFRMAGLMPLTPVLAGSVNVILFQQIYLWKIILTNDWPG